jgi:hypothetical protein
MSKPVLKHHPAPCTEQFIPRSNWLKLVAEHRPPSCENMKNIVDEMLELKGKCSELLGVWTLSIVWYSKN